MHALEEQGFVVFAGGLAVWPHPSDPARLDHNTLNIRS
jgi:hypothetical protein